MKLKRKGKISQTNPACKCLPTNAKRFGIGVLVIFLRKIFFVYVHIMCHCSYPALMLCSFPAVKWDLGESECK